MTIYRSAAKINLTLDVLSRRADGFHDLASIVHTIGLYDLLRFEFGAPRAFTCNIEALQNEENLCVRAADLWIETARGRGFTGRCEVAISLEKSIPFGAGLGGGSGNAAAVLLAMSGRFDRNARIIPPEILLKIAARLGADVPLFLRGGAQKITGIGDRLKPLPTLAGHVVLVQPPQRISTPQAFAAWDDLHERAGRGTEEMMRWWNAAPSHATAASQARLTGVASRLHNDLRRAAIILGVEIEPIVEALKAAGALGSEMTGSGSAVFGLFASLEASEKAASLIGQTGEERGADWRVWMAPLISSGVQVQNGAQWIEIGGGLEPGAL